MKFGLVRGWCNITSYWGFVWFGVLCIVGWLFACFGFVRVV